MLPILCDKAAKDGAPQVGKLRKGGPPAKNDTTRLSVMSVGTILFEA